MFEGCIYPRMDFRAKIFMSCASLSLGGLRVLLGTLSDCLVIGNEDHHSTGVPVSDRNVIVPHPRGCFVHMAMCAVLICY